MTSYYLCLDVGGTEIKANLIQSNGRANDAIAKSYLSHSMESQSDILQNFKEIFFIYLQEIKRQKADLLGVGIAFPGPFDYEHGRSQMQGLRKYDAIYQVDLREVFKQFIQEAGFSGATPILFQNDALAFALGEYRFGKGFKAKKATFITLGTGCGSTFIEAGEVVRNDYGINETGMIYQDLFLDKRIDDYLSVNGLHQLAVKNGLGNLDGYALAVAAQSENSIAVQTFYEFGELIGRGLHPYLERFQPDCIVFGGQISKSLRWIEPGIRRYIQDEIRVEATEDTTMSTLKGLTDVLNTKIKDIGGH